MFPAVDFGAPSRFSPMPPPVNERFARVSRESPTGGATVLVRDGRKLSLRNISPLDVAGLQACFLRLSPEDVRRRFLHAMSELPTPMAQRLCRIDPARETALVLIDESMTPAEIRGVGRIYVDDNIDSAEFSVLVEKSWTRLGLGAMLMQKLVDDCRARNLMEIWGYVLVENRPMLSLCRELGFVRRLITDDPGTAQISLML